MDNDRNTQVGGSSSSMQEVLHSLRTLDEKLDEVLDLVGQHQKKHLTVEEFACAVSRAPLTVRRWIKEGRINAIRVSGSGAHGRLLIDRAELNRLI